MDLIKITDLTDQLGISSRSLRYYEQVGLIQSSRSKSDKYRRYDTANIERLKQIMILRKMQIPIKDIIRIYESEDMSVVVETFVNRIRAIDDEVDALEELRIVVNEFLQAMIENGVTKISTLPILYEKMEERLDTFVKRNAMSYRELSALSDRLSKPVDTSIISLPSMRVLSSYLKDKPHLSDPDGFWRWVQTHWIDPGEPGGHERFEFQTSAGDVTILKITADFANDSPFLDYRFEGGLFAVANVFIDEDLGERFRSLLSSYDNNQYYEIDYKHGGSLRHAAMLENLISPDEKRELVSLLVPVKKRLADPALFDKAVELESGSITVEEIEKANPVLWEIQVPLDKLTPINSPHYKVLENGEVEYIGWILTRALNTNVAVKLPFRVDIEFRFGNDDHLRYGASNDSLRVYYGNHGLDHHFPFGILMGNEAAIQFHQPIFRDEFTIPKQGRIVKGEYNHLTWIIGVKHLACIINGEVRYCGINFPYMSLDLSREEAYPIIIGSERMKYVRSIRISQLTYTPKKIKKEELAMKTRQSNNIIPAIHRLITDEYGENYWFNGCAKYVMECLGEPDYDYWFFAGLTGDIFTQHYSYTHFSSDSSSGYLLEENPARFVEDIFLKCGYAATYVPSEEVRKNTEMYLQTLIAYIDKGIPVISCGGKTGVFVGYEDYGKVLLYITGNKSEPERIAIDKVFETESFHGYKYKDGWIFVGEKKESRPLAEIYREAIHAIPQYQNVKTDTYCFGLEAFLAWASDIENGKFDRMTAEEFDVWCDYTNYVCVLATNGSCCHEFLKRAQEMNPDMDYLDGVSALYRRLAEIWGGDNTRNDPNNLEALGGGFNVTLEALQDNGIRSKIAAKIRECADCMDNVMRILNGNLK